MDRATDSIQRHIYQEREELRSNLEELEDRVRSAVDWRRHYHSNPVFWLGCAFGGGLLLALAPARSEETSLSYGHARGAELSTGAHRRREISRAWRTIEGALIGVAAAKLKETLAGVLPGFREQLARREGADYVHDLPGNDRQH